MIALTPTEKRVLKYLENELNNKGCMPTYKQAGFDLNLTSRGYINQLIKRLSYKKYLIRLPTGTINVKLGMENEYLERTIRGKINEFKADASGRIIDA
jgi:SOS-response transcriptional repressor LexA